MAARLTIFEAVQDMLAGRLSYIEGARKICPVRFSWGLDEWDADLRCFIGIDSETDALPFGEMRAQWQAAALEALQPEIDKKEGLGSSICRASLPQPGRALFERPN